MNTAAAAHPEVAADALAWIDTDAMREIDRAMIEDLGITLLQMMEHAGRGLADVVAGSAPTRVLVMAGTGGNGGGGLAAARHLANVGVEVVIHLVGSPRPGTAAAHQLDITRSMGIAETDEPGARADVVVDAMVGYSLRGPLRDRVRRAAVTCESRRVVSLDVPTGVDATTGHADPAAISADLTVTLCAPKLGLRDCAHVGVLLVTDISVPPELVERVAGGPAPPFARGRTLRVVPA